MKQEIFINSTPQESRIAIMEDGILAEFLIERKEEMGVAGNIYKGKVARVLPGMQAAFIEIGMEKAGFLHASDFSTEPEDVHLMGSSAEDVEFEEAPKPASSRRLPLEKQLSRGEEIMVQVAKDPLGTKGARVTSHISLPGRYMVFMPGNKHIGISRRIESDEERKRLKEIAQSLGTEKGGFILRTACEGLSKREIQRDLSFLTRLWERIQKKGSTTTAPALIHQDLDLIARTIRDFFSPETEQVVIDSPKDYRRVVDFVRHFMPRSKTKIVLHPDKEPPLFEQQMIEEKVVKALDRRVWLRSGGYLIIERTEALTAVDVNTGRFVGKRSQEETILKTNMEAVQEVVRQLRLRNVGGIIIIDFIDMEKEGNRKRVYDALKEALKKDKARTNILKISELGLVEMTRQRTRESLENQLLRSCPHCEGRGRIKSAPTIAYDVLRAIRRQLPNIDGGKNIVVRLHPDIANFLYDEKNNSLENLEREIDHRIIIKASQELHHEKYEIFES